MDTDDYLTAPPVDPAVTDPSIIRNAPTLHGRHAPGDDSTDGPRVVLLRRSTPMRTGDVLRFCRSLSQVVKGILEAPPSVGGSLPRVGTRPREAGESTVLIGWPDRSGWVAGPKCVALRPRSSAIPQLRFTSALKFPRTDADDANASTLVRGAFRYEPCDRQGYDAESAARPVPPMRLVPTPLQGAWAPQFRGDEAGHRWRRPRVSLAV